MARRELPELRLGSDEQLRARMARYLPGGEPGKAHFSEVINGRRRISSAFLAALHQAFGFETLDLPIEIWLAEELEATFVTQLRSARQQYLNPLEWLHHIASEPRESRLQLRVHGGLLGIGFDHSYQSDRYLPLTLGQRVHLEVLLPSDGWLTFFNAYPAHDFKGPMIHWIDPALRNNMKRRPKGRVMLPEGEEGILVGRPTGPNSLFAVLWSSRPAFPWLQSTAHAVEIAVEDLRSAFYQRNAAQEVGANPGSEIDVALLNYNVLEPEEAAD